MHGCVHRSLLVIVVKMAREFVFSQNRLQVYAITFGWFPSWVAG